MDMEEAMEEEKVAAEQKKRATGESQYQHLFKDGVDMGGKTYEFVEKGEVKSSKMYHAEGQEYNPTKRFGTIDDEGALIYENITTSYPAYLPTENY